MKPFLKWPGGKRWLVEDIAKAIGNIDGRYIEPFLGGGSLFFFLEPKSAILSDANRDLIETYLAVRTSSNEIEKQLLYYQQHHSKDFYYAERSKKYLSLECRAAQFIYLNRTCFNGIYRVNLRGEFNVPLGSKTSVVMPNDNFKKVAEILESAQLCCNDFEEIIDQAETGDVVFADPPYTVKHNVNGFIKYNENLFAWSDQIRLHDALSRAVNRGARVYSTNANHASLIEIYASNWFKYKLSRHSKIAGKASARSKTSELLISSEDLSDYSFCTTQNTTIALFQTGISASSL